MHELTLIYRANGRDVVSSTQWFHKSIVDNHFMHLFELLRVMPKRVRALGEGKDSEHDVSYSEQY